MMGAPRCGHALLRLARRGLCVPRASALCASSPHGLEVFGNTVRDGQGANLRQTSRKGAVFRAGDFSEFQEEDLVPVKKPWQELLSFIVEQEKRVAYVRAPPQSGKTFLGKMADRKYNKKLELAGIDPTLYDVRYCQNVDNVELLLQRGKYRNLEEMAEDSGSSGSDNARPTIIYYFDECHTVKGDILSNFVTNTTGYAIFATAGRVTQERGYVTPRNLIDRMFYYHAPAEKQVLADWVSERLRSLFSPEHNEEVFAGTELLMNFAAGHIGILQHLGQRLQTENVKNLAALRMCLAGLMLVPGYVNLATARCLGLANGTPDESQAQLISMLRCCGSLQYVDEQGRSKRAWDLEDPSHQQGLSSAFFAPVHGNSKVMAKVDAQEDATFSFTHGLQPELYAIKYCLETPWAQRSHMDRWVTNFSHDRAGETFQKPNDVIDLVLSWLSHVETLTLLDADANVDSKESSLQNSFRNFAAHMLKLKVESNYSVKGRDRTTYYLDHLVEDDMGVELLVRHSKDNKLRHGIGSKTWTSLLEHVNRAETKYKDAVKRCKRGYVTVLVTTASETDKAAAWERFQSVVVENRGNAAFAHPVMVAIAPFGWTRWDVFLHLPSKEPLVLEVTRQRLLLKLLNDQVVSARHFYPAPREVWVQLLEKPDEGGELRLVSEAFTVLAGRRVDDLEKSIRSERGIMSAQPLPIYCLDHASQWVKAKRSQVLHANLEERPYGYSVPPGARHAA